MANPIEEIKAAKDGLDVLPDLYRYAANPDLEIPADDLERLKWYGLFHRRATPGFFMLRLRLPNGILSSEQISGIGELVNDYGRGQADITTRQNIQLRWITIADAPRILQRLYALGLTAQQSGMDNVRNIVGCPLAGLDPREVIDARPLAHRLQQAIIGDKTFSNLPRKFNLSISGCRNDCAHAQTHDLAFTPAQRDRTIGFNVVVGGALGGREPALGVPLDAFVSPNRVVDLALAILTVFRDQGPRESRKRARLKILIAQCGIAAFRDAVERELGSPLEPAGETLVEQPAGQHLGVLAQRPDGHSVVGLLVPVGRISGDDLIELGRLARVYGQAELRLTVQQNVLLPHVPSDRVPALLREPLLQRLSPDPSPWLRGLVACTGSDYCHFSLIDTKGEALALSEALAARYTLEQPVRLHWSGCPHACGQHKVADVGFEGARVRTADGIVSAASLSSGGRLGANATLAEDRLSKQPIVDLPEQVAAEIARLFGPQAIRPRGAPDTSL